jgi:hypothetical protein
MSEFIINCIVLHCSADTVHCECFHCELQCLVGTCVRLQPTGPRRQAGGTPPRVARVLEPSAFPRLHTWAKNFKDVAVIKESVPINYLIKLILKKN